jgi:hypothetical protein
MKWNLIYKVEHFFSIECLHAPFTPIYKQKNQHLLFQIISKKDQLLSSLRSIFTCLSKKRFIFIYSYKIK